MGPKRMLPPAQESALARRYMDGASINELSKVFNIARSSVGRTLARLGVATRPETLRPRVPDKRRKAIVAAHVAGATMLEVAVKFGVSTMTVQRIVGEAGANVGKGGGGRRRSGYTLREDAFDVITPESAYWMGFLFTDGSVGKEDRASAHLACNLAECDRGHIEKLLTFLGSNHAITRSVSKRFGGPAVGIRIRSPRLVTALLACGMEPRKAKRSPCDELIASRDFWRGCVDGDGSIGIGRNRSRFYPFVTLTGQPLLLTGFQSFLAVNGLARLRQRPTDSGIFRVHTSGWTAKRIIVEFYDNATAVLFRKGVRAQLIANHVDSRHDPRPPLTSKADGPVKN